MHRKEDRVNTLKHVCICLLLCSAVILQPPGLARESAQTAKAGAPLAATQRDGQHDFDFEIGTWKTHLKRLLHPLTGSTQWVDYNGTTVVRKV